MSLFVRNETSTPITCNLPASTRAGSSTPGPRRFELAAKGNVGSTRPLPLEVAQTPGFLRVWTAGSVTVSQNADFSSPLTAGALPSGETSLQPATTSVGGSVKQVGVTANSTATTVAGVVADYNALLAKLRTAGIIANP